MCCDEPVPVIDWPHPDFAVVTSQADIGVMS